MDGFEDRNDRVSVVIPTVGRESLFEAVRSVQAQTYAPQEILVVQDGADEETKRRLEGIGDPRIRVLTQTPPRGASAARNRGAREARGRYIAFLDDDDIALPSKLATQVEAAIQQPSDHFYVVCAAFVEWEGRLEKWPRRFPLPEERVADYLFSRTRTARRAFLQTSCLLIPRSLLLRIPLSEELKQHQDWDWLLEAEASGVRLIAIDEPLVRYRMHNESGSISTRSNWKYSLEWLRARRASFSRKTYSFFIAVYIIDRARAQVGFSGAMLRELLHEYAVVGRPTLISLGYLAVSLLRLKRLMRNMSKQNYPGAAPVQS